MNGAENIDSGLFQVGPPLRLQRWLGLITQRNPRVVRRVVVVVLVGWLPLAVLAAMEGTLRVFLSDFAVHARSLVAVSLFIIADAVAGYRLAAIAIHFLDGGIVPEEERGRFGSAVLTTRRLIDSAIAEAAVIILAYAIVAFLISWVASAEMPAWHSTSAGGETVHSPAGWWHALVSVPLLLLLFLGWVWRLLVWTRFLWLVSRLELRLVPSHPDRAAGLKFVGYSARACSPLGLALGTIVAGTVANGVMHEGAALLDYKHVVIGVAVFVVVLFNAPLLVFIDKLLGEWRRGIFEYGALADAFGRQFERRWLKRGAPVNEDILERPDFSAATDLYQVVDRVHEMRLFPFDGKSVLLLACSALLPFVPVVLMAVPFDLLFAKLAGFLF